MTEGLFTRRDWLAAAALATMAPRVKLFAAPTGLPKLLVVFLRGAYDSSAVLVPRGNSFYMESRPTLAIPSTGPQAAVALDGNWGLAPVMVPSLMPLWRAGELAFLPFAGNSNVSRSHFETQDFFELGLSSLNAGGSNPSGFMNRLARELTGVRPLAFTAQLPLTFRGALPVANNVPKAAGPATAASSRRDAMLARMYAGDRELGTRVTKGFEAKQQVSAALADEMVRSGRGALGAGDFEGVALRIATVMRGGVNLGFVDVGGWDTHAAQEGNLNFRLGVLGRGLAGFGKAMGPDWRNTLVVVVSEFGRTFRENGSAGTDHGHGTVFWLLGGALQAAQVGGAQVKVSRATLHQDRDFPVLNDYRVVLGGIFQRLYGLDAARLGRVFPGAVPRDLGLI